MRYLEIRCKWVWKPHISWKCAQDKISQLNAVCGYDVTEPVMIIA